MDRQVILLAHNIRSLWNVGSLFRTSDAFAVEKIFLTGYTAIPPRREISKTAIGAEEWVPWEYQEDPLAVIQTLKNDDWSIVALEQGDEAVELQTFQSPEKVCLIIGHEVTGVPEDQLALADHKVHIPMLGKKQSLNVSVATGIMLNQLRIRM